jgi:O-antigen/teichoic acid export membrane protein
MTAEVEASSHGRALHILETFLVTFGIQAIGLFTGVLVARVLGVEGRGQLAAVILWPSVVTYLGDLGLPLAYVYESARDRRQIPALIGNALVASLAQWLTLSVLGSAIVLLALHRFGSTVALTGAVFLVTYLPLNLLTRYLNAVNQGSHAFLRFNAVRFSVPLSYAVVLVLLMGIGLRSVQWVVVATLLANGFALTAVLALSLRPLLHSFGAPRTDLKLLRRTLGYGLRAHIGNLTPVDSMQVDLLLVTLLLGASDAGLYSVAISASMVLRAQGTALGLVALPEVAAAPTAPEQRSVMGGIFRLSLLINLATAGTIVAVAGLLVPGIYGRDFAPAVPIVRILVLGIVAASLRQLLGDCLRGAGKPLAPTIAEIASWVVGLTALGVLVPMLGLRGAALGVSLSYSAGLAVVVGVTLRSGARLSDLFIPRPSDLYQWWDLLRSVLPVGVRRRGLPKAELVEGRAAWDGQRSS